jgi:tripartite-type tricarboxylate transporter receptor subunit TctC
MPHVATGKVKILGVASAQPPASLPQVPAIAAGGVPGFDLDVWFGVAAPAKTPPDVVARLAREIAGIMDMPDVKERIAKVGLSTAYLDGGEFREQIRADHERFGKIIRDAGIVPN